MIRKKEKYYLVVNLTETDGDCNVRRLTGDEIRALPEADKIYCGIIEGNMIKGFDNINFDFTKL